MSDRDEGDEVDARGLRLRGWATRALWPVAIGAPVLPVLVGIPARIAVPARDGGPTGDLAEGWGDGAAFLTQLVVIDAVLLLGCVIGALLVRARLARDPGPAIIGGTSSALVTRYESWAVLAQAGGGILFALGIGLEEPNPALAARCLIMGLWAIVVGTAALIVLAGRALRPRTSPPEENLP
ncbi:hypothetical protein [Schumannella sp. 10F1B-5-1]|uniref:hypothetical protein n=1 Tax=Schumannella sp. 10F1B-5-1 TaxID=2590780 RepID=UPI0011327D47|nr:hypothetical protein [Schumannella sp. 10F1B-5-1]TPW70135.1 hypothetical protein FJ658_14005 [Schumannella sp. 10F1B-5-1]